MFLKLWFVQHRHDANVRSCAFVFPTLVFPDSVDVPLHLGVCVLCAGEEGSHKLRSGYHIQAAEVLQQFF